MMKEIDNIEQFLSYLARAKVGDRFIYFIGSLAFSREFDIVLDKLATAIYGISGGSWKDFAVMPDASTFVIQKRHGTGCVELTQKCLAENLYSYFGRITRKPDERDIAAVRLVDSTYSYPDVDPDNPKKNKTVTWKDFT